MSANDNHTLPIIVIAVYFTLLMGMGFMSDDLPKIPEFQKPDNIAKALLLPITAIWSILVFAVEFMTFTLPGAPPEINFIIRIITIFTIGWAVASMIRKG